MRLEILAIGRARAGPERTLYETYAGRLVWPVALREFEEKRRLPPAELKNRESAMLLEALPRDAVLVALDEAGHALSSEDFAGRLGAWRDEARATVAFVIGGAGGLTDEVRDRANLLLAFGRQTWPHMLVRAMLMEQIYRAQQILAGHPYHRG
ncbi:MAG: 23S rRNA (pseudouridine(1915)-N(3))-methyltransferase RlmH [Alphaproteobacteria bacterium]|nr:23S rRNA (pseudouridine(1915)-N(3))-methyltransferase RlmH [Alphaproteobacteria bacterium]